MYHNSRIKTSNQSAIIHILYKHSYKPTNQLATSQRQPHQSNNNKNDIDNIYMIVEYVVRPYVWLAYKLVYVPKHTAL